MPGNNDRQEQDTHIAAVIDKPGEIPTFGGIDDGVVVDSEHVTAANAFILVSLLTHVSNDLQKPQAGSGHSAQLTCEQPPTQGSPELCLCQAMGVDMIPITPREHTPNWKHRVSGWAS